LVVLQILAEHLHSEVCQSSSRDEDQAISSVDEVFLDAEEEVYPVVNTFPRVEAEPEVSLCLC
jgi:hypothetical protein